MKKALLLILSCVYLLPAWTQQDSPANRHYMDFSLGWKTSTGKKHMPYDLYRKGKYTGFSFRYSLFLSQHWGIYADTQIYFPESSNSSLILPDPENYYVISRSSWWSSDDDIPFMASLGVTYRLENKYFCIRPYFGAGISTRAECDYYRFIIKEKGSNLLYRMEYENQRENFGYLNAGATASWKITRKFHLHFDIGYIQYLTRQGIVYSQENMYTHEVIEKDILKAPLENFLNIKVGLSFAFGHTMRK